MKTYVIAYTDLDTWTNNQKTVTRYQEVEAASEQDAIEWFCENVQCDYDDISEA